MPDQASEQGGEYRKLLEDLLAERLDYAAPAGLSHQEFALAASDIADRYAALAKESQP